jgi:hypothetical protein
MSNRMRAAMVVAMAGAAAPAWGQDSVSALQGLANTDALDAWSASDQNKAYVVDMQQVQSEWGTTFQLAPIYKLSRNSASFPTAQNSAAALSAMSKVGAAPAASYRRWTAPGFGVHPNASINQPGTAVTPPASTIQMGAAFTEFGTTVGAGHNGVVGGLINYSTSNPSRMYVTRMGAAINGANSGESTAQFGLGSVDASGNVNFRADDNGTGVPAAREIVLQNLFRVRMLGDGALSGRNFGILNVIDNNVDNVSSLADNPATDWLVARNSTTHNVPSMVPRERGLGVLRNILLGTNFGTNYVYESAALTIASTTAHRPAPWLDHRGNVGYTPAVLFPGTVGTCGIILKNTTTAPDVAAGIGIWGVDGTGNVSGTQQLTIPASVTDTGQTPAYVLNFDTSYNPADPADRVDGWEGHRGATAFRGGPPVALGRDQAGNLVVAGLCYVGRTVADYNAGSAAAANWPYQALLVGRIASPGAAPQWSVAAWIVPDPSGLALGAKGKQFVDGNGVARGEIRTFDEFPTQAPFGPSISNAAIDSVGNVWFIATYDRYTQSGGLRNDPNTGIFRAVWNPSAGNYRLELVVPTGLPLLGVNSTRNYKIIFMSLVAGAGGPSPSSIWSNAINQDAFAGANPASLQTNDSRTLGGLVVNASIIYDVDGNDVYESLTGASGNPSTLDQNYNVVLLLTGTAQGGVDPNDCFTRGPVSGSGNCGPTYSRPVNAGHFAMGGANGVTDTSECKPDWDGDGCRTPADVASFVSSWFYSANNPGNMDGDYDCSAAAVPSDVASFVADWFASLSNPAAFGC